MPIELPDADGAADCVAGFSANCLARSRMAASLRPCFGE